MFFIDKLYQNHQTNVTDLSNIVLNKGCNFNLFNLIGEKAKLYRTVDLEL